MSRQRVEINLRIPRVKDPNKNAAGYPIDNSVVRFIKLIELNDVPKVGDILQLTSQPESAFQVSVARADWSDAKEMFVVACRYTSKAIPREEYLTLMADSEWSMKPLL
jgi:hypothetical protein